MVSTMCQSANIGMPNWPPCTQERLELQSAPVAGVHQERVLSSKNFMRTMVSTLYHSPNTSRPRPVSTSRASLATSSG